MLPATKPSMVWGRAERAPNDDRKREFVNSKSNYLGEVTFPPQGDSGTRDVSTFARIHLSRMNRECKERYLYRLFSVNQFLESFAFLKIFQCKDEKENSIYRRKPSPREAFENIAQIKVNVRNQMVVKSSQNWKI